MAGVCYDVPGGRTEGSGNPGVSGEPGAPAQTSTSRITDAIDTEIRRKEHELAEATKLVEVTAQEQATALALQQQHVDRREAVIELVRQWSHLHLKM